MSFYLHTADYSAHRSLACEFVEEAHGRVARKIMERAIEVGGASLKDIADYIRFKDIFGGASTSVHNLSGANGVVEVSKESGFKSMRDVTDLQIKTAISCLILHEFMIYDEETKTYNAQVDRALMRFALPAFTRFLRKDHGEAGDLIISLLGVYGGVSLVALEKEIAQRYPVLLTAAQKAIGSMRESGFLYCAGAQDSGSSAATVVDAKGGRVAGEKHQRLSIADDPVASLPFKLNFDSILLEMRNQAILVYVNERFDDFGANIVKVLIKRDNNCAQARRRGGGVWGASRKSDHVNLPPLSTPLSIRALYDELVLGGGSGLNSISFEIMRAKVAELCSDDFGGILQRASYGSGSNNRDDVCLNYSQCADHMRMNFVEKMVNARYGIVGVRIMKVLLQRIAAEDRHLAEETISSLNHVREVLIGMLRDGFVKQMDLQKGKMDVNAERNPKLSTFVWTLSKDPLMRSVKSYLVTTIRNCRLRNCYEHKSLEEKFPNHSKYALLIGKYHVVSNSPRGGGGSASANSTGDVVLTAEEEAALLKLRLSCRALQATLISQMESLMMLEMY